MDSKIDKMLKEALYDMEHPVDDALWGRIEHSVRMKKIRRIIYYTSSVAAAILLALFLALGWSEGESVISQAEVVNQIADAQADTKEAAKVPVEEPVEEPTKAAIETDTKVYSKVDTKEKYQTNVVSNVSPQAKDVALQTKQVETLVADASVTEHQQLQQEQTVEPVEEDQVEIYNIADEPEYKVKKKARSFAVSSNVSTGRGNINANNNYRAPLGLNGSGGAVELEQVSDIQYSLPLNLGVQVQFPIRGFISAGVGLNYSMLVSKYDALLNKQMVNVKQTLHYMGIPANLYFRFIEKSNFNFYGNVGVALEWGLGSTYKVESYDFKRTYNESVKGMLFSANAGLGVEYIFANVFGLYLEPNVVYYPNSKIKRSIRTDQPLQIRAEIGCRFHF